MQTQNYPTKDNGRNGPGIASPTKQHKSVKRLHVFFPSSKASECAWGLLHELANSTNSPKTLLRAIPCYPPTELELTNAPCPVDAKMFADMLTGEDLDSYVAQQAACLKDCKDCWSMLRPDVVMRQDAPPMKKGDPFSDAENDYESDSSSVLIGKNSWRLLAWFIHLFEKDQATVEPHLAGMLLVHHKSSILLNQSPERYSIFFLSQIKPAHSRSSEPRSSADPALDIIFTCYNQTDGRRRELGARLMSLVRSPILVTL
ncbi:hypothetical protein EW145_g3340 [Phellinidium pouzarii]|uniref:Uncharacterized protein n=1 Tax=Phellinidium pouzarii TaxID=167371 RepID=A0A4S4L7F7_9AGAM|nr:hypothetical protein EW145_g3340 [Phellinidium pouzarii]